MEQKNANTMVFKVNRPSFQTKTSFVERLLEERAQINNFFCTNPNPTGLQVELIARHYITTVCRKGEAEKIIEHADDTYERELERVKEVRGTALSDGDRDHAYCLAWINAIQETNDTVDKYYRTKGNEIRIAVVSKFGFNQDGVEVEFADADIVAAESRDIDAEAAHGTQ